MPHVKERDEGTVAVLRSVAVRDYAHSRQSPLEVILIPSDHLHEIAVADLPRILGYVLLREVPLVEGRAVNLAHRRYQYVPLVGQPLGSDIPGVELVAEFGGEAAEAHDIDVVE